MATASCVVGRDMNSELKLAALFICTTGPYANLPGVDPWDELRDAIQGWS